MDDLQADLRRAVLETLAGDRRSPAIARLARDVLDGKTDLRRALGEASGDLEAALIGRFGQAGEAIANTDPAELAALKQAVLDAHANKPAVQAPRPTSTPQPAIDDDDDFSHDTYRRR
ncbi:MAG: hypothetical protein HOV94_19880 [Saccharothrix sp.]|nr:hypothetical protein [Saccharothrix sp.]